MSESSPPGSEPLHAFGTRHSKSEKSEPRPLTAEGEVLAAERAKTEIAEVVRQAPERAAVFIIGSSNTLRASRTAEVYGDALADVFADDPTVHVITAGEIRTYQGYMGTTSTRNQVRSLAEDFHDQKLVIDYPLMVKKFSFTHRTPQSPEGVRWQQSSSDYPGSTGQYTQYNLHLAGFDSAAVPDGALREWFTNKGVVAGEQRGPSPEQVAQDYLAGIKLLARVARRQLPDRPIVVGFVGHSWDLDALAVYLANNGQVTVEAYDRIRGNEHGIGDAELLKFSIGLTGTLVRYRGQTFTSPALTSESLAARAVDESTPPPLDSTA